jgi:hypothetical protein
MNSKSGLSVLIFRGGLHVGHEKTWEGPEHGNQWKTNTCLECIQIQEVTKPVSKSDISECYWVHPEREDDARRHHNGPGFRNCHKNVSKTNMSIDNCGGTRNFQKLALIAVAGGPPMSPNTKIYNTLRNKVMEGPRGRRVGKLAPNSAH